MDIKPRSVPNDLKIRRLLRPRMTFTDAELKQLQSDEKGFEGECYFDQLISNSPASTYLHLKDLLLQWHNTTFQIDSCLISPHKIFLSDIKNFEGEFYIEGKRWFMMSGKEIKNPLQQLQRSEDLFRPLAQSIGLNLPIESNVVFVNPEFTLFNANKHLPIILPTQNKAFVRRLGSVVCDNTLIEAAKKLALLHIEDSPFKFLHIPEYTYETLEKGISCVNCHKLSVRLVGRKLVCNECECQEDFDSGIIRTVEEFKLLLPDRYITVSTIVEWCGLNISRQRMQRVLKEHFAMIHHSVSTYYQ